MPSTEEKCGRCGHTAIQHGWGHLQQSWHCQLVGCPCAAWLRQDDEKKDDEKKDGMKLQDTSKVGRETAEEWLFDLKAECKHAGEGLPRRFCTFCVDEAFRMKEIDERERAVRITERAPFFFRGNDAWRDFVREIMGTVEPPRPEPVKRAVPRMPAEPKPDWNDRRRIWEDVRVLCEGYDFPLEKIKAAIMDKSEPTDGKEREDRERILRCVVKLLDGPQEATLENLTGIIMDDPRYRLR